MLSGTQTLFITASTIKVTSNNVLKSNFNAFFFISSTKAQFFINVIPCTRIDYLANIPNSSAIIDPREIKI